MSEPLLSVSHEIPISPDEAEVINDVVDLGFFLGRHDTTSDAKRLKSHVKETNVIALEGVGWTPEAQAAWNLLALSKEAKATIPQVDIQNAEALLAPVHNQDPWLNALLGMVRSSGTRIRMIDADSESRPAQQMDMAHPNHFWRRLIEAVKPHTFDDALQICEAECLPFEALTREREIILRNNLRELLLDLVQERTDSEQPRSKLLVPLGSVHRGTQIWVVDQAVEASVHEARVTSSELNPYFELVQQAMEGKSISQWQYAATLTSGIFQSAARELAKVIKSPLQERDVMLILFARLPKQFSIDEMRYLWNAGDNPETLDKRWEELAATKGIRPQEIVDAFMRSGAA